MPFQIGQPDDLEGRLMGCRQHDARRGAGIERLLPAIRAQAPAIAALEPGEFVFRARGREVVAAGTGEREEFRRHLDADRVYADVLRARLAASGAEEPGPRFQRADLNGVAENVALFG